MRYFSLRLSLPALFIALCLCAGPAHASGTFVQVNSSLDDGSPGTLRWAIGQVNAASLAPVEINFPSFSGTITLASPLPPIANVNGLGITVNGFLAFNAIQNTSNVNYNGSTTVVIDASALTPGQSAITLSTNNNKVQGLNIINSGGTAITISGSNCSVEGCVIGLTSDLRTDAPNDEGIKITGANNTIGGINLNQRNVISGNTSIGVTVSGGGATGNKVENNLIGIGKDISGLNVDHPNFIGVLIETGATSNTVGGDAITKRNVISGNDTGVSIDAAPNNTIKANVIGLSPEQDASFGNAVGVWIKNGSTNNFVGGTAASDKNIISGNSNDGVKISDTGTTMNAVFGNYVGISEAGDDYGNTHGVFLANGATNNFVGGISAGSGNTIGNNAAGVVISDGGTDGNHVEGNTIGMNGSTPKPNITGVLIQLGAQANTIGGSDPATRNIIACNTTYGVYISDPNTDNNLVIGNYIGIDGPMPQGNGEGVVIDLGAQSNKVGGSTSIGTTGEGNVISANLGSGVRISGIGTDGNFIQGNLIGLTTDGLFAYGNDNGVVIEIGAAGSTIGGPTADLSNVISGNNADGIYLSSCTANVVSGNLIGTNINGTAKVQNTYHGVEIGAGDFNVIGGTTPGEANIISGNFHGVFISGISATNNQVIGNLIGTTKDGTTPLGNNADGVAIEAQASNNKIEKNLIAYNAGIGVRIGNNEESAPTAGNQILANSIHSNASLGIDLIQGGDVPGFVTPNDAGDTDTSAGNNLQNFPVLTLAMVGSNGNLFVNGTIDTALPVSTLQFFLSDDNASGYGQGKKFLLGSGAVSAGAFSATGSTGGVALNLGDSITATATTADGTSEFSLNLAVSANTPPTADAGTSQLVSSGVLVTLDGSASSDADALPLAAAIQDGNFFWSQTGGPAITLNNPNSANPTFTPAVGGTYVFSLTVSDGLDNSTAASVTIQVNGRPVISSVTGTTPVRAGATITFTATASDPENDPLTYSWSFGDGTTAGTNPADKIFTNVADMNYTVTVTVSDAVGSAQASFNVQVFAPNSGGAGTTNISTGKPPVSNPLNGLTIGVVASDGGVIEFLINVDALNRAAFDVSTDFDGIAGRVSTRTGTRITEKFTEPEIYIATTKAVDSTTKEEKGKARKTVAVGRKETGKPPKIKNRSVDTTVQKPKIKGNFFFGRGSTGAATLPRPDKVTLSAQIELPEGLDISQIQDFSIAIGNIVDTIMVDPKGKGLTPSTLGRIIKFKLKYPRLPKGTTETPAGTFAKFTMTVSGTDLSGQGFDTEGVAPGARDLDKKNSAPRDIQIVLMMGGEPYETSAPVNFKQNKTGEAGTIISGRGAQ